jgi:aminomethyltransferase
LQFLPVIPSKRDSVKRTPFYNKHVALGGKIVEFGGYEMPVQYPKGIIAEHKAVREGAGGVFDVSHMGEFDLAGPDALKFLQWTTVNDVSTLVPGKAQYSCLPRPDGGIIDDLIIYMLAEGHYMIVVNASTTEKDWAWFSEQAKNFKVVLRNDSDKTALLAIQGKKAIEILQTLTDIDLSAIEYYHFIRGTLAGEEMIISRTGYTGEPGIEIYFTSDVARAEKVWDKIFEAGKSYGLEAIGLGARDTLRLEMGYCLYGNDISDETNPLEAGLAWITKLNKLEPCLAFETLKAKKAAGLTRKLSGFLIEERGAIGRHGNMIYDAAGSEIGEVTSGNISPMLSKAIGLCYVPLAFAVEGAEVQIETRPGKRIKAVITKPPFIKPEVKS